MNMVGEHEQFLSFHKEEFPMSHMALSGREIHHKGISTNIFLLWLFQSLNVELQTRLIKLGVKDQPNQTRAHSTLNRQIHKRLQIMNLTSGIYFIFSESNCICYSSISDTALKCIFVVCYHTYPIHRIFSPTAGN